MARDLLIGVDAGTSVIKSVAFTASGRQVGACARPNRYRTVEGVGAEQDMAETWADAAATLRGLAEAVPDLAGRAAAIAVTAQGDGTWLVDADGEPAGPALIWLDARAAALTEDLRASAQGRRHFESTGSGLAACQMGPQLLWLERHRPDVMARAATAFHLKDWLYFKLTGDRAADASEGVHSFGDFRTMAYAPAAIDGLGLRGSLLPPIIDGASRLGSARRRRRPRHRLRRGPAGVPGPHRHRGDGARRRPLRPRARHGAAPSWARPACTCASPARPARCGSTREGTGYTLAFPVPGSFAQLQSNMASTLNIDWLVDLARGVLKQHGVEKSRTDIFLDLDDHVLKPPRRARSSTTPYISEAGERGPFVDASSARAQFHGLSVRHELQRPDAGRLRGARLRGRETATPPWARSRPEVRITGGAARSKALRVILGAALGTRIRSSTREEAGAAGAAMVAAVAIGLAPDMESCIDRWVTPTLGEAQDPDPALADRYDRLFPAYAAARRASAPVWRLMRDARDADAREAAGWSAVAPDDNERRQAS